MDRVCDGRHLFENDGDAWPRELSSEESTEALTRSLEDVKLRVCHEASMRLVTDRPKDHVDLVWPYDTGGRR